jgi:AraC-like DNA-binding protein
VADPDQTERIEVRTQSFDEAVDSLRRAFGDVEMRRAPDGQPQFAMQTLRVPSITSTRWTIAGVAGGSRSDDDSRSVLLTGLVQRGSAHIWSPDADLDTGRPFLYPDVADSRLDRPMLANLGVARDVVEARASAITGIDDFRVTFSRTAPIDPVMDSVWRDTMAYVERTAAALVDHPELAIAQTALLDLTATMLLRTFPNSTLDAANQRSVTAPRRAAMRRALQFIEDNLAAPITNADIAKAAGLSTRGLYAGFQRHLEMSPMAYLRIARLTAVRDELRDGDPARTTVDAIASRWGFVDGPGFVRRYREAFEETPTETLLR